jgi:hypothetical protein
MHMCIDRLALSVDENVTGVPTWPSLACIDHDRFISDDLVCAPLLS